MSTYSSELASHLAHALREGHQLQAGEWQPLSDEAEAYAVQDAVVIAQGWHGAGQPQYWKSGGASRQALITHAPLAPKGVRFGESVDFADLQLRTPAIEAEIALRMGSAVNSEQAAALTYESAAALVDAMCVSVELCTSRWLEGSAAPALLRLADCQTHGALALGEWLPFRPEDWSAQACSIQINEQEPVQARGAHSLGDPAWVLIDWLRHATRNGATLPAGSVVTTGAWIVLKDLQAGDRAVVRFERLGAVEVRV